MRIYKFIETFKFCLDFNFDNPEGRFRVDDDYECPNGFPLELLSNVSWLPATRACVHHAPQVVEYYERMAESEFEEMQDGVDFEEEDPVEHSGNPSWVGPARELTDWESLVYVTCAERDGEEAAQEYLMSLC